MSELRRRTVATGELTADEIARIRELLWAAFGDDPEETMTEDDWQHALGGSHHLLERDGEIVAHAAVVTRELHAGEVPLRTGYVEAVAVDPALQRQGLGARLMAGVMDEIRAGYELGALGTGVRAFYEQLGWERWAGPTGVRTPGGLIRTPDEDGYILVLRTPTTPRLDQAAVLSCEPRSGEDW